MKTTIKPLNYDILAAIVEESKGRHEVPIRARLEDDGDALDMNRALTLMIQDAEQCGDEKELEELRRMSGEANEANALTVGELAAKLEHIHGEIMKKQEAGERLAPMEGLLRDIDITALALIICLQYEVSEERLKSAPV